MRNHVLLLGMLLSFLTSAYAQANPTAFSCSEIDVVACQSASPANVVVQELPPSGPYVIGQAHTRDFGVTVTTEGAPVSSHIAFTYTPAGNISNVSFQYKLDSDPTYAPVTSAGPGQFYIDQAFPTGSVILLQEVFTVSACSGSPSELEFVVDDCFCFSSIQPSAITVDIPDPDALFSASIQGHTDIELQECPSGDPGSLIMTLTNDGGGVSSNGNYTAYLQELRFALNPMISYSSFSLAGPGGTLEIDLEDADDPAYPWLTSIYMVPLPTPNNGHTEGAFAIDLGHPSFPQDLFTDLGDGSHSPIYPDESLAFVLEDYGISCSDLNKIEIGSGTNLLRFGNLSYLNPCQIAAGTLVNPYEQAINGSNVVLTENYDWTLTLTDGTQPVSDIETGSGLNMDLTFSDATQARLLSFLHNGPDEPELYAVVDIPADYKVASEGIEWLSPGGDVIASYSESISADRRSLRIEVPETVVLALDDITGLEIHLDLEQSTACSGSSNSALLDDFFFEWRQGYEMPCSDCYVLVDRLSSVLIRHCPGECGGNAIGSQEFTMVRTSVDEDTDPSNDGDMRLDRAYGCDELAIRIQAENFNTNIECDEGTGTFPNCDYKLPYLMVRYHLDAWNLAGNPSQPTDEINLLQPQKLIATTLVSDGTNTIEYTAEIYADAAAFDIEEISSAAIVNAGQVHTSTWNTYLFVNNGIYPEIEGKQLYLAIRLPEAITFTAASEDPLDINLYEFGAPIEFTLTATIQDPAAGGALPAGVHPLKSLRGAPARWNGKGFDPALDFSNIAFSCDDYGASFEFLKVVVDNRYYNPGHPQGGYDKCDVELFLFQDKGKDSGYGRAVDDFPGEIRPIQIFEREIEIDLPDGLNVPLNAAGNVDHDRLDMEYFVNTYTGLIPFNATNGITDFVVDEPARKFRFTLPDFDYSTWDCYQERIIFHLEKSCGSEEIVTAGQTPTVIEFAESYCEGPAIFSKTIHINPNSISVQPQLIGIANPPVINVVDNAFVLDVRLQLNTPLAIVNNIWMADAPSNGITILSVDGLQPAGTDQPTEVFTDAGTGSSIWNLHSVHQNYSPNGNLYAKDVRLTVAYDCSTNGLGTINDVLSSLHFGFSCSGNLPDGFCPAGDLCWMDASGAGCTTSDCVNSTGTCDATVTEIPMQLVIAQSGIELSLQAAPASAIEPCEGTTFTQEITVASTQFGSLNDVELHIPATLPVVMESISGTLYDESGTPVQLVDVPVVQDHVVDLSQVLDAYGLLFSGLFTLELEVVYSIEEEGLCGQADIDFVNYVTYRNLCNELVDLSVGGTIDNNAGISTSLTLDEEAACCQVLDCGTTVPNDNLACAFPVPVQGTAFSWCSAAAGEAFTTTGATKESGESPPSCYGGVRRNVWFRFENMESGELEVRILKGAGGNFRSFYSTLWRWDDDGDGVVTQDELVELTENPVYDNGAWTEWSSGCTYVNTGNGAIAAGGLDADKVYFLSIDHYASFNGPFDICVESVVSPDFAYQLPATVASYDIDITAVQNGINCGYQFSTSTGTPDLTELNGTACHSASRNIWLAFQGPASGEIEFAITPVSPFRSYYLSIWEWADDDGTIGNGDGFVQPGEMILLENHPTLTASDAWSSGCHYVNTGIGAIAAAGLESGKSYFLCVDNYASYNGTFDLCVYDAISLDFAHVSSVTGHDIQSISGAQNCDLEPTTALGTPDLPGLNGVSCHSASRNIWLSFAGPSTGEVEFEVYPIGAFRSYYLSIWEWQDGLAGAPDGFVQDDELILLDNPTSDVNSDAWSSGCYFIGNGASGAIAAAGLKAGGPYFLCVDNYASYKGAFDLCASDEISYDFAYIPTSGLHDVPDIEAGNACNLDYATSSETPDLTGLNGTYCHSANRNIWLSFDAPSSGEVEFSITPIGSFRSYYLSIWEWNDASGNGDGYVQESEMTVLDNSTQSWSMGCHFTSTGAGSIAATGLNAGLEYFLLVDNYASFSGSFDLCAVDEYIPEGGRLAAAAGPTVLSEDTGLRWQFYPNPFRDKAALSLISSDTEAEYTLRITDLTGRQVRQYGRLSQTEVIIEKAGLTPGMYLLQIFRDDATQPVGTIKMVIE